MPDNEQSRVFAFVNKWIIVILLLLVAAALLFVTLLNGLFPLSVVEEKSDGLTVLTDTLTNVLSAPTFAVAKLIAALLVFIFGALVLRRIIRYARRAPELIVS